MMEQIKHYGSLLIWIIALLTISSLIGYFNNANYWYLTLERSSLTPPGYVFGTVWPVLYIMIAISGWLIWSAQPFLNTRLIQNLYIAQILCNFSWTPLFFGYQLITPALICLLCMLILVISLIIKSYKDIKWASFLLIPYCLWLTFASYLSFYIWMYN